jgi:hypothetical protein
MSGTVNLSCLVAFSPSSTTSKSLILGLGFRKFRPQNGRILLKLTVPPGANRHWMNSLPGISSPSSDVRDPVTGTA